MLFNKPASRSKWEKSQVLKIYISRKFLVCILKLFRNHRVPNLYEQLHRERFIAEILIIVILNTLLAVQRAISVPIINLKIRFRKIRTEINLEHDVKKNLTQRS